MNLETVIAKYDVDNGFKRAVSKVLARLSKEDVIDQLTQMVADLMYAVAYDSDMEVDNGSNIRIDVEEKIKGCLEEMLLVDTTATESTLNEAQLVLVRMFTEGAQLCEIDSVSECVDVVAWSMPTLLAHGRKKGWI